MEKDRNSVHAAVAGLKGKPDARCHPPSLRNNGFELLSAAQVASFPLKETDIALITASVYRA